MPSPNGRSLTNNSPFTTPDYTSPTAPHNRRFSAIPPMDLPSRPHSAVTVTRGPSYNRPSSTRVGVSSNLNPNASPRCPSIQHTEFHSPLSQTRPRSASTPRAGMHPDPHQPRSNAERRSSFGEHVAGPAGILRSPQVDAFVAQHAHHPERQSMPENRAVGITLPASNSHPNQHGERFGSMPQTRAERHQTPEAADYSFSAPHLAVPIQDHLDVRRYSAPETASDHNNHDIKPRLSNSMPENRANERTELNRDRLRGRMEIQNGPWTDPLPPLIPKISYQFLLLRLKGLLVPQNAVFREILEPTDVREISQWDDHERVKRDKEHSEVRQKVMAGQDLTYYYVEGIKPPKSKSLVGQFICVESITYLMVCYGGSVRPGPCEVYDLGVHAYHHQWVPP